MVINRIETMDALSQGKIVKIVQEAIVNKI